ncbi:MAG: pro-sigmaK processing inhibitor BofA family protein [Defluviitaleaceae bacterium]|nr:pro-sigmaK processing inhibitor BofA family protein [Defluviitaleaceae bacterium]
MSSSDIIMLMIGVCVVLIIYLLFSNPLKMLVRVALGGAAGVVGMLAMNTFLAPLGVFVGINPVTVLLVGILGLPGFAMLYIASFIFK